MSDLAPIPEEDLVWDSYYRLYYDDEDDDFQNSVYTSPRTMAEGGDFPDQTNEKPPLLSKTGDGDTAGDNTNPWDDMSQWQYGEDGKLEKIPTRDTDSTQPLNQAPLPPQLVVENKYH